mgnify:CR=1 FL=1
MPRLSDSSAASLGVSDEILNMYRVNPQAGYIAYQNSLVPEPIDYAGLMAQSGQISASQTRLNAQLSNEQAEQNLARFPQTSDTALDVSMQAGRQIDDYMQAQINRYRDELMPGWRENLIQPAIDANIQSNRYARQYAEDIMPNLISEGVAGARMVSARAQQFLSGEVPADVAARTRQIAAESSAAGGLFGAGAQARSARDFGLTSLDMITQGAQLEGAASGLRNNLNSFISGGMGIVQQPIASGSALTNLAAAYMPQISNVGGLYGNALAQITGIANLNPNQVMSSGSAVYGSTVSTAGQLAMANQEMDLSRLGIFNDFLGRQSAQSAQNSSETSAMWGAAGSVAGSVGGAAMSRI